MCRLFGFRSVIQSQVHRSLVSADNALAVQSQAHPDGWGVAYYLANIPHLIRSASSAQEDCIFERVSGIVASETVLAHVRKATVGTINSLNSHPFQYGRWVFAHNGNIPNIDDAKPKIITKIAPRLRRYILGDTDSEMIFYLLLTQLTEHTDLHRKGVDITAVSAAIKKTLTIIQDACAPEKEDNPLKMTIIITDGQTMLSLCWGPALYYSSYKTRCLDRDTCPFLSAECEAPSETGYVNHMIFSSEHLQGDNVWTKMNHGQIIGVDWRMHLFEDTV